MLLSTKLIVPGGVHRILMAVSLPRNVSIFTLTATRYIVVIFRLKCVCILTITFLFDTYHPDTPRRTGWIYRWEPFSSPCYYLHKFSVSLPVTSVQLRVPGMSPAPPLSSSWTIILIYFSCLRFFCPCSSISCLCAFSCRPSCSPFKAKKAWYTLVTPCPYRWFIPVGFSLQLHE